MKKFIIICMALAMFCACALSESAMEFRGDIYCIVPEEKGDALVRFEEGTKPLLSERAEEISSLTMFAGDMYYLRNNGRFFELICRDKSGSVRIAHAFEPGQQAAALSAYGENMFLLLNGNLHMIYPEQGLCLKLAGAKMTEYVISGDFAYYISGETQEYSLDYAGGTVIRSAGNIYRVNLSTGDTAQVVKSGAYGLGLYEGKLYFHSLERPYAAASGERAILCGKITAYDIATGDIAHFWNDYDWGYVITSEGVAVRNALGLNLNGEIIPVADELSEIVVINGRIAAYDPVNIAVNYLR